MSFPSALDTGKKLDHFRIDAPVAESGMASIFRATDLRDGKQVALKVPHFAMVNLIAGEEVVPELVQHDFTAANVVERVREILPDGEARNRMLEGMAGVTRRLRGDMGEIEGVVRTPAQRAAGIILGMVGLG